MFIVFQTKTNSAQRLMFDSRALESFLFANGIPYKSVSSYDRQVAPGITGPTGFAVNTFVMFLIPKKRDARVTGTKMGIVTAS